MYKSDTLDTMHFVIDNFEAFGYVSMNIDRAIKVLENKGIAKGSQITENGFDIIDVDLKDFDKGYVENNLLLDLLYKCKKEMNKKENIFDKSMNKKINELYQLTSLLKKRMGDDFYSKAENTIVETEDIIKDNIKYQVSFMNMDDDKRNYFVYLLLTYNNKSIPFLLLKQYTDINEARIYYNELYELVMKSSNRQIIDKCYKEKFIVIKDMNTMVIDLEEDY